MATTITFEEWERWRNAIHTLYILDNLPLLGPSGVIETMKLRHNFRASKRQYEYRLQQWGFEKNMPGWYYPTVETKLGKRKLAGDESNVYWKGELVPAAKIRKESSRHGYMTTLERLHQAQENPNAGQSPKTPPGVQICTAPPYFLYRKVLQDLPILQLLRSMNFNFNIPHPLESSVSTPSPILWGSLESSTSDRIINAASALIPISAFNQELPGSSSPLDNIQHSTSIQILKVVAYATSNNFPTNCNRTEIYKWLKGLGTISPQVFQLLQASSNQALLQGLFRLAIEEEDVFLASTLLNAGADPNENVCMHKQCPIPLRPLQYACLVGNLELVKELLRVTAVIDRPECGWSCSPVLFAINGCFAWLWKSPLTEEAAGQPVATSTTNFADSGDDDDDDDDDVVNASTPSDGGGETQVEALIMLIRELLNAGADINAIAEDLDDTEYSLKEWLKEAEPDWLMYPLICEKHSALTLGSSFRCPELVDFLIRNGADVGFHINGNRSALRECLYVSVERDFCRDELLLYPMLEDRLADAVGQSEFPSVVETAKRLIMAQVDVNDHEPCDSGAECEEHDDFECYSAFDLGMLTQDKGLVNAMWAAGAKPTCHSLDIAIKAEDFDLFCQLLDSEARFPEWAVTSKEWDVMFLSTESRLATEVQKRRAMILAAIRMGACWSLERLIQSYDCSNIVENGTVLTKAIEECCRNGHHDTLVSLLQSNILPRDSAANVFGSSIALALIGGDLKMVDVLLAARADVNKAIPGSGTPLEISIETNNTEYVQKLIDHGANIECPTAGNLLVKAINRGDHNVTQFLMAYATPDSVGICKYLYWDLDTCGWYCPLAAAIYNEQWPLVDQLLQYGPSLNPKCRSPVSPVQKPCMTPLWASVDRKNMAITQLLIQRGAEVNDELALKVASKDEDSVFLKLLVEELSADENSGNRNTLHGALHTAMSQGHLKNFRLILDSGMVDVHAHSNGKSLLHYAIHSAIVQRYEFLQLLLESGLSPDYITYGPQDRPLTALLEAINERDPQCVRIILETHARTNSEWPPETAYSPLQLASFKGNLEIVRILLCHGQDPDMVSSCTKTYEWYSLRLMTYHRIGTCVQNATMEKNCEILKLLLRHGANPNATTTHCPHTALQIACRDGSQELVGLLLEYGANVNLAPANAFGATALQFAAIGGFLGIAHLLLEKGAEVNAAPAEVEGRTALEGAAEHGRIDMVQLLVNAGADISEPGQGQYERALQRASMKGHTATGRLLRSFLS